MLFGRSSQQTVNLALQGGGAHGAFTWGVLDQLLEDGRIGFEGVSGTSAGAMNAVVLAHGLINGDRDGARAALEKFWTRVAGSLPFEVAVPSSDGQNISLLPAMKIMLQWAHYFSPHQLNPFDLNPLRDILQAQVDLNACARKAHSSCSLPRPMPIQAKYGCFARPRSAPTLYWHRLACPPWRGRSKSMESLTGMGAMPPIRPSTRFFMNARATMC